MSTPAPPVWHRLGRIFGPDHPGAWWRTHAQVPTVLVLVDRLRVYVAVRPHGGFSLPTFVDLDRFDPRRVIAVHPCPVLGPGPPGSFDADGVMPSSIVDHGNGRIWLYYSGWCRLGGTVPYHNATGLAESIDGGVTFRRLMPGPILDRCGREPFSATSPTVVRAGGDWHMWYSSGTDWLRIGDKWEHVYDLRHASSTNGTDWVRDCAPAIAQSHPEEALVRPALLARDRGWHMWFSARGSREFRDGASAYRLVHAWSQDLLSWRRDSAPVDWAGDTGGWEDRMVCYPAVVTDQDRTWLFYNGNGFGAAGFGIAEARWTDQSR